MIAELLKPAVKEFIKEHAQDNPAHVALRHKNVDGTDIKLVVGQIIARQKATRKFSSWSENYDLIFPDYIAVEQASSLITAGYKASLISGKLAIDLTGGLGIDSCAFSSYYEKVVYVEADALKAAAAQHNFTVLGKNNIEVVHSGAEEFLGTLQDYADLLYIDPDRRPGNERVLTLQESSPDVVKLQPALLAAAENVLIKSSPMLDITATVNQLSSVCHIHVVAVQNECKELLFHIKPQQAAPEITAASFAGNYLHKFTRSFPPVHTCKTALPKMFIYEPDSALLKSGLQDELGREHNLEKLHPSTQLFTSDNPLPDFQGRSFKLIDILPVNKKVLKSDLPEMKANLSTRNFPEHVDKLKKKLQLKDGGNYYIFACRLADLSYKLLLTRKL